MIESEGEISFGYIEKIPFSSGLNINVYDIGGKYGITIFFTKETGDDEKYYNIYDTCVY